MCKERSRLRLGAHYISGNEIACCGKVELELTRRQNKRSSRKKPMRTAGCKGFRPPGANFAGFEWRLFVFFVCFSSHDGSKKLFYDLSPGLDRMHGWML